MQHYFFRKLLAFIMVRLIQRELDIFKGNVWNIHLIRDQKGFYLQSGVPSHSFNFPEDYNLRQFGKI